MAFKFGDGGLGISHSILGPWSCFNKMKEDHSDYLCGRDSYPSPHICFPFEIEPVTKHGKKKERNRTHSFCCSE